MLIFIIMIAFVILYQQFILQNIKYFKINIYTNDNYILSISEKQTLGNRLKNSTFFDKYEENIDQYVEIKLNNDEKDGKAWGTVSLNIDKNIENDVKKILQQTNETISTDSRVYGIIDNYGSIYIEKYYVYNKTEKIKLVFSVNLPYKYNSIDDYNEFVQFFLKFNS